MNFLDSITLVRTLPCLAEPGKIIVIGKPSRSLEEVIPYLATLPSIIAYNPERCTLTFRRQPGFITIQSDEICITQVKDVAEGLELLDALTNSVNAVWEKRDELVAMTAQKRAPQHLDIWALLPQTNCRECGEATCLAFAVGLIQQKWRLSECPPLRDQNQFHDRRIALEKLF
ncbi:MAG: (Fe-S)-binding protein [Chloroflexota bacterium]